MGSKEKQSGPAPQRVKIDSPWEQAISKAIKKKRPPEGWPQPKKKRKKP